MKDVTEALSYLIHKSRPGGDYNHLVSEVERLIGRETTSAERSALAGGWNDGTGRLSRNETKRLRSAR